MSRLKTLCILLVILALGFATAPSWIDSGANISYSSGGNTITFSVASRSGDNIQVLLTMSSPMSKGTIIENASADSDEFWYDPNLLANSYEGEMFGNLSAMGTSQQSFAGQTWNAITLQGMIDGAQTTRVYDVQTGLLLKQSVDASGAPDVVLVQEYIPALIPPAPPVANVTPPQNNTPPPAQPNTTAPVPNATQPTTQTQPTTTNTTTQTQPVTTTNPSTSSNPCCLSSFMIGLVGFVAIKGFRK